MYLVEMNKKNIGVATGARVPTVTNQHSGERRSILLNVERHPPRRRRLHPSDG